jgi:hypothetical protein
MSVSVNQIKNKKEKHVDKQRAHPRAAPPSCPLVGEGWHAAR